MQHATPTVARPETDPYRKSRFLYILEAAFEYFISLLLTGAFLARVTTAIGMSDAETGIVSAFVSLGSGFQFVSIFLAGRTPVKHWVTALHIVGQVFYALVYAIPFLPLAPGGKIALFTVCLLLGQVISNIISSPKINWYMTLVPDGARGRFTATKEMVSLLGGMTFSMVMGFLCDRYYDAGNVYAAFLLCAITICVLSALHTLTLVFSKEKPTPRHEHHAAAELRNLFTDRNLLRVVAISVLWNVANYATMPFFGTYQNRELGFSLTFVALLSVVYSIARSLCSRPFGRLADRFSFATMLKICYAIEALGFLVNMFTVPANGKVFYTVYYVLNAIGMAGVNSGEINLIYDYVAPENRTGALALKNTLAGTLGFLSTLAASALVSHIQASGNRFLGISVYAQQVLSAIGLLITLGILLYLHTVIGKIQRGVPSCSGAASCRTDDGTAG